jgi:molybdopterin synthase catalytic subunit/GNAT superfamily N-acetyltransferase
MQIRPVRPADQSEWLRLRCALWPTAAPENLEREIATFHTDGKIWGLVAQAFVVDRGDGRLGGFIEVSLRPFVDGCSTGLVGYLEGWFVESDLRRQRIGTALVRAAEQWAVERGCREMGSDCLSENHTSHLAHLALGYLHSEPEILFHKELREGALVTPIADWAALVPFTLSVGTAVNLVADSRAGGIDLFVGTTRSENSSDGRSLIALDYEAYGEMAERQLRDIAQRARERWPMIRRTAIVHRVGRVEVGDPSVIIAVSTPHRAEAFEACRWIIDMLKKEVAIWKKEVWSDGKTTWVNP